MTITKAWTAKGGQVTCVIEGDYAIIGAIIQRINEVHNGNEVCNGVADAWAAWRMMAELSSTESTTTLGSDESEWSEWSD